MNHHRLAAAPLLAAATVTLSPTVFATNGDQMLGATATQWGMAGAVVAAPQDSATVFYNPAGLTQLEFDTIRFDSGLGLMNPPRSVNGVDSDSNLYLIPSGAYARRVSDRMVFGLGMGGISGMGVDVPDALPVPGNQAIVTTKQLMRIAPSVAYQVNPQLALGAAFNINYLSLALYNPTYQLPQNQTYGYGFNLGLTYQATPRIRVGATYLSEQEMQELTFNTLTGQYRMTFNEPSHLAAGIAFEPSEDLLIEFDVRKIGFSDVRDRVELNTPSGVSYLDFGWSDQTVYALGVQKRVSPGLTVRGGLNYGESPIGSEDVNNNLGSVAITEMHATLGLTRHWTENMSGSISYAHAFENELTASVGPANTIQISQNVLHLQFSFNY